MKYRDAFKYHTVCARATLYPNKTIEEVEAIVDELLKDMSFADEDLPEDQEEQVWVTYDPLLEKVVCVHDAPDCVCDECQTLFEERNAEGQYHLEEQAFVIRRYNKGEIREA